MRDLDQAHALLEFAARDLRALEGMSDATVFAEEIFGFHTQQTAEKALKAWLAIEGVVYPKTHDLSHLLNLLEEQGVATARYQELIEYTAYAVQLRYEALDVDSEPLDRGNAVERLRALLDRVRRILSTVAGA